MWWHSFEIVFFGLKRSKNKNLSFPYQRHSSSFTSSLSIETCCFSNHDSTQIRKKNTHTHTLRHPLHTHKYIDTNYDKVKAFTLRPQRPLSDPMLHPGMNPSRLSVLGLPGWWPRRRWASINAAAQRQLLAATSGFILLFFIELVFSCFFFFRLLLWHRPQFLYSLPSCGFFFSVAAAAAAAINLSPSLASRWIYAWALTASVITDMRN